MVYQKIKDTKKAQLEAIRNEPDEKKKLNMYYQYTLIEKDSEMQNVG